MKTDIKTFGSKESPVETTLYENNGMKFRCFSKDDKVYVCLKDLGESLDSTNYRMLLKLFDEDEYNEDVTKVYTVESQLLGNKMLFVSESGMYKIFLRSNLPKAEPFADWVCREVLPSIRKYGYYMTPQKFEKMLDEPDFINTLLNALQEQVDKKE